MSVALRVDRRHLAIAAGLAVSVHPDAEKAAVALLAGEGWATRLTALLAIAPPHLTDIIVAEPDHTSSERLRALASDLAGRRLHLVERLDGAVEQALTAGATSARDPERLVLVDAASRTASDDWRPAAVALGVALGRLGLALEVTSLSVVPGDALLTGDASGIPVALSISTGSSHPGERVRLLGDRVRLALSGAAVDSAQPARITLDDPRGAQTLDAPYEARLRSVLRSLVRSIPGGRDTHDDLADRIRLTSQIERLDWGRS